MKEMITLSINGRSEKVWVQGAETLLDVLRNELSLMGAKRGCDRGECGTCTVLLDGRAVRSCLYPAKLAVGHAVVTIEGLAQSDGTLDPIQEAFIEKGAIQCGFCTPGMILSAKALLDEVPGPDEAQVRRAVSGNLCRCTGYTKIVEAIQTAGDKIKEEGELSRTGISGKQIDHP